jgi:pimeloyl-ACP methyl ester carboxylesterase
LIKGEVMMSKKALFILFSIFIPTTLAFAGTVQLPQTGQTTCYNTSGTVIDCTGTGQDGELQAGVAWPNPWFTDKGDQTMQDNLTGLVWAKDGNLMKTRDPGFDSDSTAGDGRITWQHALDYIKKLNQENYLGHNDWRLPNVNELESLVHTGQPNKANYIISQGFSIVQAGPYWSSSTFANYTSSAWFVSMYDGYVLGWPKLHDASVWPVRSGQSGTLGSSIISLPRTGQTTCYDASGNAIACSGTGQDGELQMGAAWPSPRFTDKGDQTVTDNLSGLVWTKDVNAPGPTTCGPNTYKTWQGALDSVKCLNTNKYLGYSDWRLPNRKELRSLVHTGQQIQANYLTSEGLYNGWNVDYWSSSTSTSYASQAWKVSMYDGNVLSLSSSNSGYVWPVRSGQSESLGSLVIASISSPQQVGTSFNITVTVINSDGGTDTSFNGNVSLSTLVPMSPTTVKLTNGSWTGPLKLLAGGINLTVYAAGAGRSGTSNPFSTAGAGAATGNLGGQVNDNQGNRLSGATVYLSATAKGPDAVSPVQTDSFGHFLFQNVPAGQYYIWATQNGQSGSPLQWSVPAGGTGFVGTLAVLLRPTGGLTPVVLIPGILGSTDKSKGNTWWPRLKKEYGTLDSLILHDPFGKAGWSTLKEKLRLKGLKDGTTIIDCPWDWRVPFETAVEKYLIPAIDEAKKYSPNGKVNIISHSMGGLVARSYIQGSKYNNWDRKDVDQLVMIGTPHKGSANMYYVWEGGDPKYIDDLMDGYGFASLANYYWNSIQDLFGTYNGWRPESNDHDRIQKFVHDVAPLARQLLPTYDFLNYKETSRSIASSGNVNQDLIGLNKSDRKDRMSKPDTADPNKVKTHVYYGFSQKTIDAIPVTLKGDSIWDTFANSDRYPDGQPKGNPTFSTSGDGTVPSDSAKLPCDEGWAKCNLISGEHSSLVKDAAQGIANILYPGAGALGRMATAIQQSTEPTSQFTLSFDGRVQPLITDPAGNKVGTETAMGQIVNNLPATELVSDSQGTNIAITAPLDGVYTVTLTSLYEEDDTVIMGYMDDTRKESVSARLFSKTGQRSFQVTLNSGTSPIITLNQTPPPPEELQATPLGTTNPQTHLAWKPRTAAEIVGYRIYSRLTDEPLLSLLGTSTSPVFDISHPWAATAAIPARWYAVAAVTASGEESFLSMMVTNDDRDHDGLTDAEEAAIGTDTNQADSDHDGLTDGEERNLGTNPLKADTDGDGYSDKAEILAGSDPLDPTSIPLKGDINGDGKIDLEDAVVILQIMSGLQPAMAVNPGADVNGDGKIGFQEVIYILQKAAAAR